MLISIHDSALRRVAYMDNNVPKAIHYYNDSWRRLLKEATSTFSFTVDKVGHDSEQYLTEDNYVSFKYEDVQYLFNIMRIEETEQTIIVYTENLNLELLNETKMPIDVTTAKNLVWYLNNDYLLIGAGLTLGVNEVSDQTRKIKLESEQTGLARLISIANNFDSEIEFVTKLNSDGTLKKMTVNFYRKYNGGNQGVGTNRQNVILYYGKNIEGITRTVDKTDVYNVITPTGKDGLNINSLVKKEYDEKGVLEYYTDSGNGNIYAPQSKNKYRSQLLNDTDGWIRRYYTADGTTNINTLYSLALNELKKHAYPSVTYDVTGYFDLNIGDTVRVQDDGFTPSLTLQVRVAEQSICFSNPSQNKTIFGNILALESKVSADLTGRLKELVDAATPYRFEIVSSDGLTFKNSSGSTTLTARVYKGSAVTEVSVDSFEWLLNGVSFGGTSKNQVVSSDDVSGTAVVRYNAIVGDVVIGGVEVTLQDVSDGVSGRGVDKVDQKWLVQSSSTVPTYAWSNSAWKTAIPEMTTTNKYLYMIERTTYTDSTTSDAITLSAVYGDNGAKGDIGATGSDGSKGDKGEPTGIIKSETEPANKFVNMIWYVNSEDDVANANMEIGTVAQSHGTYTWTGSTWSLYKLRSVNMEMDNGFIKEAMIDDAQIGNAKIKALDATKITTGTLEAARIAANSITVDKMSVSDLASINANLGNIIAGTYTTWSVQDGEVYDYLSGIYIFDGHVRSIVIENPSTTNPDTASVAKGVAVRGTDMYAGMLTMYMGIINTTQTANNLLKGNAGTNFWSIANRCGSISSYQYGDGTGQLSISADETRIVGDLNVNGDDVSSKRSKTVTLNYGMTAEFRRRGNLVHVTFPRQVRTINATSEDGKANETIPVGYRPAARTEFNINRNTGSNVQASLLYSFLPTGEVRCTNSVTAQAMYSGSTMYFTDDPMPS